MRLPHLLLTGLVGLMAVSQALSSPGAATVDVSGYHPACGVAVRRQDGQLRVTWPLGDGAQGVLRLQLHPGQPLIEELGIAGAADGPVTTLLRKVNPVTLLTVGSRDLTPQGWNVFFDNPRRRP